MVIVVLLTSLALHRIPIIHKKKKKKKKKTSYLDLPFMGPKSRV